MGQGASEANSTDPFGHGPDDPVGRGSGNSRNARHRKAVRTEIGDVRVEVPRDRNGTFALVMVAVGQRPLGGLGRIGISLCAIGF